MIAPISVKASPAPVSFVVRRGREQVTLSYQQLFAMAHKHWRAQEFSKAHAIFRLLTSVADRGPRAHMLLAHCQAMQNDFGQCSATLTEALANGPSEDASVDLHEAFVFWRVGLWKDVARILQKITKEHPDFPTPYLLLGDVLSKIGYRDESLRCLRQAIRVDRRDGAIGVIARQELAARGQRGPSVKPSSTSNKAI